MTYHEEYFMKPMSRSRDDALDEPEKKAVLYPVVRLCLSGEVDGLHYLRCLDSAMLL